MIIENSGLNGLKSELGFLDEVTEKAGFFRGQWDYYRATYDLKIEDIDSESNDTYYLRINTRAIEGKLENPHAVLVIEDVYVGRATFPHGLEYEESLPSHVSYTAKQVLKQLVTELS